MNIQLSQYEQLLLAPKRVHVSVTTSNVIFCQVCKVGNRIIEGEKCGICEKLKTSEVAA